jgi:radical SAM superfamily enzyme YgiQ (UPF0313 family)
VVLGGTHATTAREEATRFADAVVVGEAEGVWPHLLNDFDKRQLKPMYEGGFPELGYLKTYPDRELFRDKYQYRFSSIITTKGCGAASSAAFPWLKDKSTECATSRTSSTRWRRFRSRA